MEEENAIENKTEETSSVNPDISAKKIEDLPKEEPSKKTDKILIISIIFLVLLIALFFSIWYFIKPKILTIDDLTKLNIDGKLKPEEGYLYKGIYSFIKSSGLWFFQLKSPSGKVLYDIPLHFGARELEDLKITGRPNQLFTNSTDIYITFDPLATDLQYTALAVSELDQSLLTAFAKNPIAACDKNETSACKDRPIITCDNTKNTPVIYFKNNATTKIAYNDNCIIIQGQGIEIVRAVDRLLLQWYGVME